MLREFTIPFTILKNLSTIKTWLSKAVNRNNSSIDTIC